MTTPSPTTARAEPPPRTVSGELISALWQLGLLGFFTLAALLGLVLAKAELSTRHADRTSYERMIADSQDHLKRRSQEAQRTIDAVLAAAPSQAAPPSAAELDKLLAALNSPATNGGGGAGPKNGDGKASAPAGEPSGVGKPPSGGKGGVSPDLLAAIPRGGWAKNYPVILQVREAAEDPTARAQIFSVCQQMFDEKKASEQDLIVVAELCAKWQEGPLTETLLKGLEGASEPPSGEAVFRNVARLAPLTDRARVAALLPRLTTQKMMRPEGGGSLILILTQHHATFAAIAPQDSPEFAKYVAQDTPAGDLIRGALSLRPDWPASVATQLAATFADNSNKFRIPLMHWLEQCAVPPAAREALLPHALKMISRSDDGDIGDELLAIHLVAFSTHEGTAGRVASGAARLAAAHPELAKQLLLRSLLVYVRPTLEVMVQTAEAGQPITPPDLSAPCWKAALAKPPVANEIRLPSLGLPQVQNNIDSAIAPELARLPPTKWSRGLVIVAGDWGGPVTMNILRSAKPAELSRAKLTDVVSEARDKIASRLRETPMPGTPMPGTPKPGGKP